MIDRRALIWSGTASLLGAALARGALAADDPAGIVTAIYARAAKGKGDAGGAFVIEKATRAKYLSKSLVALWPRPTPARARAMSGQSISTPSPTRRTRT